MLDLGQLNEHIQALDNGDDTSRRQALLSLREHAEQEWATVPAEVVRNLVKSLKVQFLSEMKQPFIHKEVSTILGNMGIRSKTAIPQLVELLKEGIPDPVREAAVIALGKMGKQSKVGVSEIVQLLKTSRPALSTHIVRALGNIGCADQRVRSALVNLWTLPNQFQGSQAQVAIALCKLRIDATGLLGILTKNLVANPDASLRKSAAEALAWCNKNELDVVPALLAATLSDTNDDVRLIAQAGLDQQHLSREKAIHLCALQLKDSSYAESALRKSGPLAVSALIEALAINDSLVRMKAARTLGLLAELAVEAAPALTAALRDKDMQVRLAAAKSLWSITKNGEVVVPVLVQLLEQQWADADAGETRRMFLQTVSEALCRIGPPAKAATPALSRLAKDKNRHISESALNAIRTIEPSKVKVR